MEIPVITPVLTKERNYTMDVIRGVAVLGILMMNIPGFAIHDFFLVWNDALQSELTLNGFIFKSAMVLFDGKMRGLFTVLFGAGLILFIENKKQNTIEVADAYFRRMMWMLLFGLVDGYILLWGGDVLYEYALCGMMLFAFRNLRIRNMLIVAFVFLGIFTFLNGRSYNKYKDLSIVYTQTSEILKQGKKLTADQKKQREEFQGVLEHQIPFSKKVIAEITDDIRANLVTHRSGYLDIFDNHSEGVFEYQSTGFYSNFMETFGTILLGMALFKMGFFHYRLKIKVYRILCFIGIPLGLTAYVLSHVIQAKTQVELWNTYSWRPCSIYYIEHPGRILLILGYASALMLLCKITWIKGFLNLFSNVGRMAFTNYIMQTVLCSFYFFGFGLGHYGEYSATGLLVFVVCIWIIQITYSNIYFRYFQIGPLEWLWKRLTYGKNFNCN